MMDGRVKTLHPRLYAGLLALRDNETHLRAAAEQGIELVDLVCVNLYPFEQTVARGDAAEAEIVENIDIGGPTMIRAAAKNSAFAAVIVDPEDYAPVLAELRSASLGEAVRPAETGQVLDGEDSAEPGRQISLETRTLLATKAFALTARYDAAIATWFARRAYEGVPAEPARGLREGQRPALRREPPPAGRVLRARRRARRTCSQGVRQLHGKELSFNNLLDLSSARELVEELDGPACAIVKHNNPCGVRARASAIQAAYERAFACDPLSAYGGVIALNRPVDRECAERAERAVHRGAARARLSTRGASRSCRPRGTCACSS